MAAFDFDILHFDDMRKIRKVTASIQNNYPKLDDKLMAHLRSAAALIISYGHVCVSQRAAATDLGGARTILRDMERAHIIDPGHPAYKDYLKMKALTDRVLARVPGTTKPPRVGGVTLAV